MKSSRGSNSWDQARDHLALTERIAEEVGGASATGHFTLGQLHEALARAWMMGANVALNSAEGLRVCRICGCNQLQACVERCAWVADDLCSTCVPIAVQQARGPVLCGCCSRPASAVHICQEC